MAAEPAFPVAVDPTLRRMQLLWQHALVHLERDPRRSAYYTSRARAFAQQRSIVLPRSTLARLCGTCSLIHVPGSNCSIRLRVCARSQRSKTRIGRRTTRKTLQLVRSCWTCGADTRQPCDDPDAPLDPRQAAPRMASRGGGGGGVARAPAAAAAPHQPAPPALDLFGLGSEFIAFRK